MNVKGFTYGYLAKRGDLESDAGVASLESLFDTGINWMCLAFAMNQDTYFSTEIKYDFRYSVTDRELKKTIERAHGRGIKVCLKPMVNCKDHMWRARIDFPDDLAAGERDYWKEWFASYDAYLTYYAELAQETGCEMLCIGCEMSGTERREAEWRDLIEKIRAVYKGPLVYNTNHGREDKVAWWDAVDYIGTSAYYPIHKGKGGIDDCIAQWKHIGEDLRKVSEKYGKKLLFMEIGCRSAATCATMPWDFTHRDLPVDEDEPALFYDTCLSAFFDAPWFEGVFWWDWSPKIYDSAEVAKADRGFNIHLKKAEDVIKKWYK